MDQEKIGKFIAKLRKEKGLTQEDLAEKLKVSTNAVSKWERGICLMDMSLLVPLSEIFKVQVLDILSGEIVSQNEKEKATKLLEETVDYSSKEIKRFKRKIPLFIIIIVILLGLSLGTVIYFNFIHKNEPIKLMNGETLLSLKIENKINSKIKPNSKVNIYVSEQNSTKKLLENVRVFKIEDKENMIVIIAENDYFHDLSLLYLTGKVDFLVEEANSNMAESKINKDLLNNLLNKYIIPINDSSTSIQE